MKNTFFSPFILALLICGLISSCCNCPEYEMGDHRFKGQITLRAEEDHTHGLIKVLPISNEKELEMPSRGIIYKYNSTQIFDLDTIVYFNVACNNDIQYATNVSLSNISNLVNNATLFTYIDKFQLNFHSADMHREGPQHKIYHIKAGSRVLGTPSNLIALEIESGDDEILIYFEANQMPEDLTSDLFINRITPLEELPFLNPLTRSSNPATYTKYNIFTSHEHAH